jgi:hypothetical protein
MIIKTKGTRHCEQSEVSEQASLHSVQNNTRPPTLNCFQSYILNSIVGDDNLFIYISHLGT